MEWINTLTNFYTQNQEAIQLIVAGAIYVLGHRAAATSYAKKKAITVIFAAEKWAADLLLQSGSQKMDFVVQKVYAKLPAWVRLIVSLDQFRTLAQSVYNDAAVVVKEHLPVTAATV
ncbi:MAG: hypothetical protein H0X29_10460 [Parachlamydiaceae bacterium]|nr:hypothetical protein [Parachlamydiaceae bacterium]